MLTFSATLALKFAGLGFTVSWPLVVARRHGVHILFATALLAGGLFAIVSEGIGPFGIPIEDHRAYGYALTLSWIGVGCVVAAIVVHLAVLWKARPAWQHIAGAATVAAFALLGVQSWVS